jgi:hypothetical protein
VTAGPASGRRERLATIGGRNELLNSQTISIAKGKDYQRW